MCSEDVTTRLVCSLGIKGKKRVTGKGVSMHATHNSYSATGCVHDSGARPDEPGGRLSPPCHTQWALRRLAGAGWICR